MSRPAHQALRRIHTTGRRRPHQDEHGAQQHPVKRRGGGRKNGGYDECCEVQCGDHGVPPSLITSCDIGNGTPGASLNALKIKDLCILSDRALECQEPRRGYPDAQFAPAFGRERKQSYCSSVRKKDCKEAPQEQGANTPRHLLAANRLASKDHSLCPNAPECASARSLGYP